MDGNLILLLSLAFGTAFAAERAEWSAWRWEAPFDVAEAGMVRLEVPASMLDVSRPDLADLRVLSPDGTETPYWKVGTVAGAG